MHAHAHVHMDLTTTGLPSMVASKLCRRVVASDNNAMVLRLLARNARLNEQHRSDTSTSTISSARVEWGELLDEAAPLRHAFDLVIGSDVVYQEDVIPSLLASAVSLLDPSSPQAALVIVYANRVPAVRERLMREVTQRGARLQSLPLPASARAHEHEHPLEILCIRFAGPNGDGDGDSGS